MAGPPVVLVTGGGGQVGRALRPLLPSARYATRDELDVTDSARTNEAIAGVDVVVHLAAMTDVDRCEREPRLAEEVNGAGSRNVAAAARAAGARVIGVSSDYVFDGTATGEYSEATPGSITGSRRAGVNPRTRSTTARMWSGVVPQQPPTTVTPSSVTKRSWCSASASGVRS